MLRCDNKEKFLYLQRKDVKITGYRTSHSILKTLIKEIIVYGGDESTNNRPTVPLLADWANVEFQCEDTCLENCQVEIDISHLYHYLAFMAAVILICSMFVALVVQWSKRLKKKKF